jgi:hypothetical protein
VSAGEEIDIVGGRLGGHDHGQQGESRAEQKAPPISLDYAFRRRPSQRQTANTIRF